MKDQQKMSQTKTGRWGWCIVAGGLKLSGAFHLLIHPCSWFWPPWNEPWELIQIELRAVSESYYLLRWFHLKIFQKPTSYVCLFFLLSILLSVNNHINLTAILNKVWLGSTDDSALSYLLYRWWTCVLACIYRCLCACDWAHVWVFAYSCFVTVLPHHSPVNNFSRQHFPPWINQRFHCHLVITCYLWYILGKYCAVKKGEVGLWCWDVVWELTLSSLQ